MRLLRKLRAGSQRSRRGMDSPRRRRSSGVQKFRSPGVTGGQKANERRTNRVRGRARRRGTIDLRTPNTELQTPNWDSPQRRRGHKRGNGISGGVRKRLALKKFSLGIRGRSDLKLL